jgi:hypothetical protein
MPKGKRGARRRKTEGRGASSNRETAAPSAAEAETALDDLTKDPKP